MSRRHSRTTWIAFALAVSACEPRAERPAKADILAARQAALSFDQRMKDMVIAMFKEAIEAEMLFAQDILEHGVAGLSARDMRTYLEYIADQRLGRLGIPPQFNVRNPFGFMELQDTQELTNFFERRVAAYQVGVTGNVNFDESF